MVTEANIPSARRGIKLIDTVKAAGFDTLNEFQEFLAARGKPMIGTKGGEESLELLNSMVGQKDQYVKMYPDYVEMEERTLKTSNPKIKKQEGQKIANKLIEIADDANVLYGEKTTTKKTSFIKDAVKKAGILIDDAAKLGLKAMLPMAGPLGAALSIALTAISIPEVADATIKEPSLEDQVRARIKQEGFDQKGPSLLNQMTADPQNIGMANGGVASIFNMTRPVGFSNGGETGFLTSPPPGMEFKPTMTMEYRDFNKNGKEDRSEGLYLPRDFQPKTDKGSKKIPFFRMPNVSPKSSLFGSGDLTDAQKKRIQQLLG
jgi:hypothetical protein